MLNIKLKTYTAFKRQIWIIFFYFLWVCMLWINSPRNMFIAIRCSILQQFVIITIDTYIKKFVVESSHAVSSSPLSAAYMRQLTRSALDQIMACCLFGTKPSPELMLTYCQSDPYEQTSLKFESKFKFFIHEMCLKISVKWQPFCPGEDDFKAIVIWFKS